MSTTQAAIVIGGGIAGLTAAAKLGHAGVHVTVLEARDRIGGRIFTHREPGCDFPIELGAEFIHGRAPEIWEPLQRARIPIREADGQNWCVANGRLSSCRFFSQVDRILEKMDKRGPDESFLTFLERCFPNPDRSPRLAEAKQRALGYITGFNAADPGLVGVHWLFDGMKAEERIEGERAFRAAGGYATLVELFRQQVIEAGASLQTRTIVRRVSWKRGSAKVEVEGPNGASVLTSEKVLVTLPLAVLKAPAGEPGSVDFAPALPASKREAIDKIEMGKVMRVVLRFRSRVWETISPPGSKSKTLADMSCLFSQDETFPTWWTAMPEKLPIITGWAPFHAAERLSGKSRDFVASRSMETLSKLLRVSSSETKRELVGVHFHDWQSDPFSRGAYSYGKVGSEGAPRALAAPIENTLYFAGEATDVTGNSGTVHGAMASGDRAAAEMLEDIG
jgi:monoamine oxidase